MSEKAGTGQLRAALLQYTAARDLAPNMDLVRRLAREAASAGARFILTPENALMIEPKRALAFEKSAAEAEHPGIAFFADLARETGAFLLAGSLSVRLRAEDGREQLANRSCLFAPDGAIVARYDKIHLFDVDLPNGERYRESESFSAGSKAVLARTLWGGVGMTICYDLRFAALYRALAKAGARVLTVPSAFTAVTGAAHWHVLLRARAIETGCFVLAPAQTGTHAEGRRTFGHGLIVDPWGTVLADGGEGEGVVLADLDLDEVDRVRARIPSLRHDRPFDVAEAEAEPIVETA